MPRPAVTARDVSADLTRRADACLGRACRTAGRLLSADACAVQAQSSRAGGEPRPRQSACEPACARPCACAACSASNSSGVSPCSHDTSLHCATRLAGSCTPGASLPSARLQALVPCPRVHTLLHPTAHSPGFCCAAWHLLGPGHGPARALHTASLRSVACPPLPDAARMVQIQCGTPRRCWPGAQTRSCSASAGRPASPMPAVTSRSCPLRAAAQPVL